MKLDQRIRLLDQLDRATGIEPARQVSEEAHTLAQWATEQLGRPVSAPLVQAILNQPAPTALAPVAQATVTVQGKVLPSAKKARTLMTVGGVLVVGGLTIALTHALGPISGLVYVLVGPIGGVMAGEGLRGWLDRRAAKTATPIA